MVGCLFAAALFYIWVRIFINTKAEESSVEEWIEFPALETLLAKCDKEDKNTNIQVCFHFYLFLEFNEDISGQWCIDSISRI